MDATAITMLPVEECSFYPTSDLLPETLNFIFSEAKFFVVFKYPYLRITQLMAVTVVTKASFTGYFLRVDEILNYSVVVDCTFGSVLKGDFDAEIAEGCYDNFELIGNRNDALQFILNLYFNH